MGERSSEEETRKLLQIREYIQRRTIDLQKEIEDLRITLEKIDSSIIQKGFRTPSINSNDSIYIQRDDYEEIEDGFSIQAKDGVIMGRLYVNEDEITFIPRDEFQFAIDIPPFQSFLIDRVLENMRSTDEKRVANGELETDKILEFSIEAIDGLIQSIKIRNYNGERRLSEIKSSLRWSLDKMYDKIKHS